MKKLNSYKNSFAVGAFSLTLAALITKVLGVLYKIPLSYILTDEGMGYFNSAYTVYGFFYILSTAGVPKAVTMLTTELRAEGKRNEERSFIKYVIYCFVIIGGVITVLFIAFAPLLSRLIGSMQSLYTMLVIAPTILFVTLSGVIRGQLNTESRLMPIAASQLIEALVKLILGIAFAYLGVRMNLSLPMISAFTVLGITLSSMFSAIYLYIVYRTKKIDENAGQKPIQNKKSYLIKLFKIAIPITLSSSVLSITGIIDTGIIIRGLGTLGIDNTSAISAYGNYTTLAFPMLNLISSLMAPICIAYLPKLREHYVKGEKAEFSWELNKPMLIVSYFSAACAFAYFFYSFDLLDILFASNASAIGAEMLIYLSPSVFLLPVLTVINTALEARGKLSATLFSLSLGSAIKLMLSFLLIFYTNLGILAAPISTCFSYLFSLIISLIALRKEGIKIRGAAYFYLPLAIGFIVFGTVFCFVFLRHSMLSPFFKCIFSVGLSFVLYLFIAFAVNKLPQFCRKRVILDKK